MMMKKPLEGIQILELDSSVPAAVCGLILSDFGADVIIPEAPYMYETESSSRAALRRGKKALDFKTSPELSNCKDLSFFYNLVRDSDAVIAGIKSVPYDTLKEWNPALVYTMISGYGQDGPYGGRPCSEQTIQAESGIMSITGEENSDPVVCGGAIADYISGFMGCIGTLMAVLDAQRSGKGRFVDVSAMGSLLFGLENQFSSYLCTGHIPAPIGNNYRLSAPVGVFPCKDGALTISVATDSQWRAFAETLGHEEWLNNPLYSTVQNRIRNYTVLNQEVTQVFADFTYEELVTRLQSRHCIYGHVNNLSHVMDHPQVKHRHTFITVEDENGDCYTVPAVPIRMDSVDCKTEYGTSSIRLAKPAEYKK